MTARRILLIRRNFTGPPQHLVAAESWLFSPPPNTDPERAITVRECAEMVQQALQNRVAAAMGAAFGALAADGSANLRVETLEAEVRSLKLRTAWTERDILTSQVEQAKRTIVCCNFPRRLSIQDGEVSIEHALTEAGLHIERGLQLWELTTQRLVDDDGKESWSGVSILAVPNHMIRQKALQVQPDQAALRGEVRSIQISIITEPGLQPAWEQSEASRTREVPWRFPFQKRHDEEERDRASSKSQETLQQAASRLETYRTSIALEIAHI